MLMAEHSMCQPGRPGPQGLSHDGSPGLDRFHSAKSPGWRFSTVGSIRAGQQVLRVAVAELAVFGGLADVEIHVAARLVREPLGDQLAVDPDDLADVLGGARHLVDPVDPQRRQAIEIIPGHPLGQLQDGRPFLVGLHDQLVIDVGDIHHPRDLVAEIHEVSLDRVEDHRPDHVADVTGRIDRRAADVHPDLAGLDRLEWLLGLTQCVINAQWHGSIFPTW